MQQAITVRIENLKKIKSWLIKQLKKGYKWLKKKKLKKKIVSIVKKQRPVQILIIILLILPIALYTSSHRHLEEKADKLHQIVETQSEAIEIQEEIVDKVETDLQKQKKLIKEKNEEIKKLEKELEAKREQTVVLASIVQTTPIDTYDAVTEQPVYDVPATQNYNTVNNYAWGNCTWFVANRVSVPSSLGNAHSWEWSLPQHGYRQVAPQVGAIAVFQPGESGASWLGHVAVVESVGADGSVSISEMNVAGVGVVSNRVLPAFNGGAYFVK